MSTTDKPTRKRATREEMAPRREQQAKELAASMRQTRVGSLVEACINVLIGFTINFFANLVILPLIGFHITVGQNIFIGVLYTIVSVARSYAIRRWFNARLHAAAQAIAGRVAS